MLAAIATAAALLGIGDDSETLMTRVAAGDEAAFAVVVSTHQSVVARYCARFFGDRELAADLTQDVFVTAWNERRRYRERGKLRAYLLRIARNRCLAFSRKRKNRERLDSRWALPQATSDGRPSEARNLDRALGSLKPEHRDLIVLRYLEELELAEIADITELKLGTVKSRLSRALTALRSELS